MLAIYYQSILMVLALYHLLCALSETWPSIIWNGEQEIDFQPWLQHSLGANLIDVWFSSISELLGGKSTLPISDVMMIPKGAVVGTGRMASRNRTTLSHTLQVGKQRAVCDGLKRCRLPFLIYDVARRPQLPHLCVQHHVHRCQASPSSSPPTLSLVRVQAPPDSCLMWNFSSR